MIPADDVRLVGRRQFEGFFQVGPQVREQRDGAASPSIAYTRRASCLNHFASASSGNRYSGRGSGIAPNRVIVTEGEKAADAARNLGFTATTSAGGSQPPGKTDWRPLAGKEVWILPDNDSPGRKYASAVAGILAKFNPVPVVKVVELPGLPEAGDIANWIDAHGDGAKPDAMRAEVEELAESVEPEVPDPPADGADRFRPFPVEALPQPIRGFVAAGAKAIGCDPSYLALPLLEAPAERAPRGRPGRLPVDGDVP